MYRVQRVVRNLLPERLAAVGRRLFGGIPGGESHAPQSFADHYVETLEKAGRSFAGATVLIFGHGPSYGFACALLATGAEHVLLFDPYAPPDDALNARWLERYPDYLERADGSVRPKSRWMTIIDPAPRPADSQLPVADIVVSTSVYEHLADPDLWTGKLAAATASDGINVHMIDLRDHFFHMPFEMLAYSSGTWDRWLNPRQNLNRWRLDQYDAVFRSHFERVDIEALERDPEAFAAVRDRIRPEFLSGDSELDAITEIEVVATGPRPNR